MRLALGCALGAACVAALVACKRSPDRTGDDRPGTATVTGAELRDLSTMLTIERLVAARCLRETACNNVGPGRHFADHETCLRELRSDVSGALTTNECPQGIDTRQLDECMAAIHDESCNDPVDTLSRLAACRTGALCPGHR